MPALTSQQIQYIKDLKAQLGIDERLGGTLSRVSHSRGVNAGIDPVSPQMGQRIVEETFNVVIKRVAEDLGD
jgi:hypothetical protein